MSTCLRVKMDRQEQGKLSKLLKLLLDKTQMIYLMMVHSYTCTYLSTVKYRNMLFRRNNGGYLSRTCKKIIYLISILKKLRSQKTYPNKHGILTVHNCMTWLGSSLYYNFESINWPSEMRSSKTCLLPICPTPTHNHYLLSRLLFSLE